MTRRRHRPGTSPRAVAHRGSIGGSRPYRTLTALADAGLLDRFDRDGEEAFRRCSDDHRHHIVYETCNQVEEITSEGGRALGQ